MTPFVGATNNSNGITGFVSNINQSLDNNVLGVNYNGSPCEAFYHQNNTLFSDDVKRFHFKESNDSKEKYLFVATSIKKQRENFSHGHKADTNRLKRLNIMLPAKNGQPDYSYMEQYIINKYNDKKSKYINYLETQLSVLGKHKNIPSLSEKHWDEFKIFDNILSIESTNSGIDENKLLNVEGKIPYLTRKGATDGTSNGIKKYISIKNMENGYNKGNVISVGLDTQTAFYQPFKFITGQNIQIISGSKINKYSAMFLIPIIKKQMDAKFNWGGNGATLSRMKSLKVLLPINDNGNIDWQYMEQYSKNMIIKKYKQYLNFIHSKRTDNNE